MAGSALDLFWARRVEIARLRFKNAREGGGGSFNYLMVEEDDDNEETEFVEPSPSKILSAFIVITDTGQSSCYHCKMANVMVLINIGVQ